MTKICRTYNGLLKSLARGEQAVLRYTSMSNTRDGKIVYLASGTNLILTTKNYEEIAQHLQKVD